ncbi:unnamed protein product [Euphydryas editha]|uniref:Uncharacterized protein n=1 Tax=Euphydryas editha TaxID=104508 RepID=A0AAU9UJM4_EUPED|nr:unnamed protein product [Euphydryas editha]
MQEKKIRKNIKEISKLPLESTSKKRKHQRKRKKRQMSSEIENISFAGNSEGLFVEEKSEDFDEDDMIFINNLDKKLVSTRTKLR